MSATGEIKINGLKIKNLQLNAMRVRTEEFPVNYVALASFAKALAHPARISIVSFLRERGEAACGDIVSSLPLKQPTVSRHLKDLRKAGLVKHRIDGASNWYSLQRKSLESFCGVFRETLHPSEQEGALRFQFKWRAPTNRCRLTQTCQVK